MVITLVRQGERVTPAEAWTEAEGHTNAIALGNHVTVGSPCAAVAGEGEGYVTVRFTTGELPALRRCSVSALWVS